MPIPNGPPDRLRSGRIFRDAPRPAIAEDTMQIQLARWGNSLGVRIPKAYAGLLDLKPGDMVDITPSPDGLFIATLVLPLAN